MSNKLDRATFEREIRRLTALMSKLIPVDHMNLLYDELSWIPTEAWSDIIDDALDLWETWPRNFPKAIKALWFGWLEGASASEFVEEYCGRCDSEGLIRFEYEALDRRYSGMCACGHCRNYRQHFGRNLTGSKRSRPVPRWTFQELQEKGYKVLPFADESPNWREELHLLTGYDIPQEPPF